MYRVSARDWWRGLGNKGKKEGLSRSRICLLNRRAEVCSLSVKVRLCTGCGIAGFYRIVVEALRAWKSPAVGRSPHSPELVDTSGAGVWVSYQVFSVTSACLSRVSQSPEAFGSLALHSKPQCQVKRRR